MLMLIPTMTGGPEETEEELNELGLQHVTQHYVRSRFSC